MIPGGPAAAFLAELERRLCIRSGLRRRILDEALDHLEEAASRRAAEGLSREQAERAALEEFGAAEEVADCFATENCTWEDVMFPSLTRLGATALVAFTCAIATMVLVFNIAVSPDPLWQRFGNGFLAGSILIVGVVSLYRFWSKHPSSERLGRALIAASILLIPLGGFAVLHAIDLGRQTGDFEFYIIDLGLALICQGFLTVLYVRETSLA